MKLFETTGYFLENCKKKWNLDYLFHLTWGRIAGRGHEFFSDVPEVVLEHFQQ